jgi:hypothetical protein
MSRVSHGSVPRRRSSSRKRKRLTGQINADGGRRIGIRSRHNKEKLREKISGRISTPERDAHQDVAFSR